MKPLFPTLWQAGRLFFAGHFVRTGGVRPLPECGTGDPLNFVCKGRQKGFLPPLVFSLLLSLVLLILPATTSAVPPGTNIDNTAQATYDFGIQTGIISPSNTITITTILFRTPSTLEFMQYAPTHPAAEPVTVSITDYSSSGTSGGPFVALPPPTPLNSGVPLDLTNPIPLVPTTVFHQREPTFMRLIDPDQNMDSLVAETVLVAVAIGALGERELLRLTETGPSTGVFTGYIQSAGTPPPATPYDGNLTPQENSELVGDYVDPGDNGDTSVSTALFDPYGVIFDSSTGSAVDNATITLIDTSSGLPATVWGDDGVSSFPATITSGGTATDSGGTTYNFLPGGYRFPFVVPGSYRLDVVPPPGYISPSSVPTPALQSLPGAPFAIIEPGSRGEPFVLNPGPAFHVDIPIDSMATALWLTKTASKEVVAVGDFLQYSVNLENNSGGLLANVLVTDRFPMGFRYQAGSVKIDGADVPDPAISSDGHTLSFALGSLTDGSSINIRYVLEVAAGARLGEANNHAFAQSGGGLTSNIATATVVVKEDFFNKKTLIMGRVIANNCDNVETDENDGMEGARIYLEDGTYVITDEKGMFHFEGVTPGVHVVQLDLDSLPAQYEAVSCEKNTRFAGRAFSQFVDLQAGTMWRTDFHVALKPRIQGVAGLQLTSVGKDDTLGYKVRLNGARVSLRNLRLTLMLPDGVQYMSGSSILDNAPLPDPSESGGAITYRMGDASGDWVQELRFRALRSSPLETPELVTKAVLTFDSPLKKNQRTPVVENVLQMETDKGWVKERLSRKIDSEGQNEVKVETLGLRPGEKWETEDAKKVCPVPGYEKDWLTFAQQGTEWLWPQPGHNPPIPSLKLIIKHHPAETLTLLLDGEEVSPLNFEGTDKNESGTIAISRWRGVDLHEGDNHFEAIVSNTGGKETGRLQRTVHYSSPPIHAEFIKELSQLIADGRNPPVIAVRLTDKDGMPAREGVVGTFFVNPPYASEQELDALNNNPLADFENRKPRYTVGQNGIALVKLQPTSKSGEVVLHFPFADVNENQEIRTWLQPEARDWILVGLAEGTMGYNSLSGNMENLDDSDIEDTLYEDGRIAFFAKGRVKGEWLLTIAYDTEKDKSDVRDGLFQTIDPDTYYTLYGDNTQQYYDAAGAQKLYLRIERDQFYALFGDYDTGLTVTELSRYSRSFDGIKSEMQTETYEFNLFATDSDQSFIRDEIRGDGTSGLYRLSRKGIVINSEKVVIETRDRFKSEEILSSRPLTRHMDYNIDYDAGTLFFKEPIYSKDENFNPNFIVIDYETGDTIGDTDYTYGGRGAVKLMDQMLEVGVTYIHEGQGKGKGELGGVDATLDISENTQLRAEFSATETAFYGDDTSGNAYLAELTHRSENLDAKVYARELDVDFGLGQQNNSETGTRKLGADATYYFSDNLRADGQIYRRFNLETDAERDLGEATINYTADSYTLYTGILHAEDRFDDGTVNRSNQITAGGSKKFLHNRLQLRVDHEQSLGGNNDNVDFPTRTILGADYNLTHALALFGEHEFTWGEEADTQGSRIGLRATPWEGGQVCTAAERQYAENGARIFANLGLSQLWKVSEKWGIDGGLDYSRTIKDAGYRSFDPNVPPASGTATGNDFTALSLGTTYRETNWSWNWRGEYRHSSTEDKWGLLTGIYGELKEGLGVSTGVQIFTTDSNDGPDNTTGDIRLGLAYRPRNTKWIVLDRLDFIFEEQDGVDFNFDTWRIVNNIHVNYKSDKETQIALQYGAKYVKDNFDNDGYSGYTDFIGTEVRHDLTEKWDIGIHGSLLHSWHSDQFDYSSGASLGYNVYENMWVSVGYNFVGFEDRDFSKGNYTAKGPFIRFRIKIDQKTASEVIKLFDKHEHH